MPGQHIRCLSLRHDLNLSPGYRQVDHPPVSRLSRILRGSGGEEDATTQEVEARTALHCALNGLQAGEFFAKLTKLLERGIAFGEFDIADAQMAALATAGAVT